MPHKATGKPNGRPRKDRAAPALTLGDDAATYTLAMPSWWFAMAHLEAELRHNGRWGRHSLSFLAASFTTSLSERGKSPSAVTKARKAPQYQALVKTMLESLALIAKQAAADPQQAADHRADVRAAIIAAMEGQDRGR